MDRRKKEKERERKKKERLKQKECTKEETEEWFTENEKKQQWKKASKLYYNENRELKLQYTSNRYANPTVSDKKKKNQKDRYAIPSVSDKKKKKQKERYAIPSVSDKKKKKQKERYAIPSVSDKKKKKQKECYAIPSVSDAKKKNQKEHYSIPSVSDAKKKNQKDRYTIPSVSDKKKKKQKERYLIPSVSDKKKKNQKDRYTIPSVYAEIKQKQRDLYATNPNVSAAKKQKQRELYATFDGSTMKKQRSLRYYIFHKKNKLENLKHKYYKDRIYYAKKVLLSKNLRQKQKKKDHIVSECIKKFRKHCKEYPVYICTVCGRHLFRNQVQVLNVNRLNPKQMENANRCVRLAIKIKNKRWICKTCYRHLKLSKVPPQALINNMELLELPDELNKLNVLERHLVSPVIPFMKIVVLPKSSQKGIHGPVICVNSDVVQVVDALPRPIAEGTLIKVKLKRKMSYKGHHLYQQVQPKNVYDALEYLKNNNPLFKGIKINVKSLESNDELVTEEHEEAQSNTAEMLTEQKLDDTTLKESEVNDTTAPLYSSLQPVDMSQHAADLYDDLMISMAPAEKHTPIPVLQHEAQAFPYHFPNGRGCFGVPRNTKLTLKKYLNARLLCYDARFASDPQYIFFAQYAAEVNDISSSISIAIRKSSSNDITADDIRSAESLRKVLKNDEGFRFLKSVRGSPMYWEREMKNAFAMLRQIGIPAFFITLSAADRRWPEMIESICKQTNQIVPGDLDWTTYCSLINSNIVTATRMFDKRLKYFINDVIKSPSNPVGQVVDMFGRIEFQARGWPHYHGLLWVKNSPIYQEEDASTVSNFIDKYITCSMPPKEDEELYEIVSAVQIHSSKHTKSCRKGGKECRFNFPRPPSQRTFITETVQDDSQEVQNQSMTKEQATNILQILWINLEEHDNDSLTASGFLANHSLTQNLKEQAFNTLAKKPTIIYKRDPSERWVNGYNAELLRAWNGNMDLQFVTDPYSCIMYIISYMTKSERELSQTIKTAQQEARCEGNLDAVSELRKLGQVYMTHKDVSVMESVYRVCSLPLKLSTRDAIWIPSDPQSTRLTLPLNILRQQNENSDKVWMTNILDRYYSRPKELEDICVADFASTYRVLSKSESKTKSAIELMDGLGFIAKRKGKNAIIRYPRFHIEKDSERNYANILCLFHPHRNSVKPESFELFEDYFKTGAEVSSGKKVAEIVLENMSRYEKIKINLEEVWEEMKESDLNDVWGNIAPSTEQERDDLEIEKSLLNDFDPSEDIEIIPELAGEKEQKKNSFSGQITGSITSVDNSDIHLKLKSMNERQQQIFNFIRSWCLAKVKGDVEPFHIFVNGGAGTGKSHLIHCIRYEATKILRSYLENPDDISVLLAAFTGTAAFNIYGLTVHKAFSINSTSLPYQGLGEESLNTLRSCLQNVSIVIIDEISMISKPLMEYISGRLQQIKKTFKLKPFGNVSLLVVGDFYQLPPVTGQLLYRIDQGALPADLWTYFHIFNLTEVMRQKDDLHFAAMLNRLRTNLKGENISVEDEQMLKSRLVANEYPKEAIHIFATRKMVDDHNTAMIHKLGNEIFKLEAADMTRSKGNKTFRRKTPSLDLRSSLPSHLNIAEGARVMLTSNLDVSDGLVNGVCGTVIKIICGKMHNAFPDYICIKFDNDRVGRNLRKKYENLEWVPSNTIPISASSEKIKNKLLDVTRHMFPLKLAWACTIHKVQGQTYKEVVISLQGVFRAGMSYVALSRCVNLEGIHLLDLDTKLIYADSNVANAMQLMPELDIFQSNPLYRNNQESFSIVHHNIQSLSAHFDDLRNNKEMQHASVICLTETWLFGNKNPHTFELDGYSFYESLPVTTEGKKTSGIALFIRNSCRFTFVKSIVESGVEVAIFNIFQPERLFLAVVYRHPDSNSNLRSFAELFISMTNVHGMENLIVLGDMNEDLYKENHPIQDHFTRLKFCQVITKPTTLGGTLLDHIYIYNLNKPYVSGVMSTYYSYHDPVFITLGMTDKDIEPAAKETIAKPAVVVQNPISTPTTHKLSKKKLISKKLFSIVHHQKEFLDTSRTP